MSAPLNIELPNGIIESIAERVAALLAERESTAPANGWLRGAEAIARYIDSPKSRVYALASCHPPRIPVHKDGSALIARRPDLDAWVLAAEVYGRDPVSNWR